MSRRVPRLSDAFSDDDLPSHGAKQSVPFINDKPLVLPRLRRVLSNGDQR